MGILAEEIKELRTMVKLFSAGKIGADHVETKLKIYKESHKRVKLILDALIASGRPNRIESRLHGLNVLSKGEFVQLPEDVEVEMVSCPDQGGKAITRADCLGYSGDTEHIENCQTCDNFKVTRRLLLGQPNG